MAGTSEYSRLLAEWLLSAATIKVQGVITPAPKPVGRDKILTPSPVAQWADAKKLPKILVGEKIDESIKIALNEQFSLLPCDVLLVADFGYYLPKWLLALPRLAPINIHPSRLPAWRGSSPAQRVLLAGETSSAVTVLKVTPEMDAGEILAQLEFSVDPKWNSQAYYDSAFGMAARKLATILTDFAAGKLKLTQQPSDSPTPMAYRLTKADSYVSWSTLAELMGLSSTEQQSPEAPTTGLLVETLSSQTSAAKIAQLDRATRAFNPWPKVWTLLPTPKGWKRLILHEVSQDLKTNQLVLNRVQLEGKNPSSWNEIKNNWQPAQ